MCCWFCVAVGPALLLEHPPRPGLRGLLVDALHVLQGTRALLIGVLCLGLPLPPLGALVTQAGTTEPEAVVVQQRFW